MSNLFSGENKRNISKCHLLNILHSMLSVLKAIMFVYVLHDKIRVRIAYSDYKSFF